MADNTISITPGSGASVRTITNAGVDSGAHQQVVSIGDSAGNLLGTSAAPMPVLLAGGGGLTQTAGTLSAAGANTPGTAAITSTTGQIAASVATAGNVTFALVTSAFVGTLIFEGSVDAGLNYGPIMAIREDGTGAESSTAISTAAAFIRIYTAALPGLAYFRVRVSSFTSGSVAVILAPGPTLIEPNPSLAAGTNSIGTVGSSSANVTGTMGVLNATVDGTTDLSAYGQVRVAISGTYTGTVTFQVSNDGTNWSSKNLINNASGFAGTSTTAVVSYYGDIGARFFRTSMTSYTSGTATATIQYTATPASVGQVSSATTGILSSVGGTGFFYVSTGTNAAQIIKASATSLQTLLISNTAASTQYVKLYNATAVTLGTTAAAVDIPVAAAATLTLNLGANGQRMTTGLCLAITGAAGATNNTANTAGVYIAMTYV